MAKHLTDSLTYFFNSNYTPPKSNVTLLQMSTIQTFLQSELADIESAKKKVHSHWFS